MIQDRFDVLLVGAGAAATATAMRVLQFTSQPLSIAMVERFPQRGHENKEEIGVHRAGSKARQ